VPLSIALAKENTRVEIDLIVTSGSGTEHPARRTQPGTGGAARKLFARRTQSGARGVGPITVCDTNPIRHCRRRPDYGLRYEANPVPGAVARLVCDTNPIRPEA
jgi:hypothetical protein